MVSESDLVRRWPRPVGFARNPLARRDAPYGAAERRILSHEAARIALDAIRRCPHYAPTPLVEQYFNKVSAPKKRLLIIEDAGHFALATHQTEVIAALKEVELIR